eukprot:12457142-Ditylum_brightwellii.AAC.1
MTPQQALLPLEFRWRQRQVPHRQPYRLRANPLNLQSMLKSFRGPHRVKAERSNGGRLSPSVVNCTA